MDEVNFLGIDVGTTGVRAALVNSNGALLRSAGSSMAEHGSNHRDPRVWRAALDAVLDQLAGQQADQQADQSATDAPLSAISVDATSGTVVPIDASGNPVSDALMYNDPVNDIKLLAQIKAHAPVESAVHGASSALARAMTLQAIPGAVKVIHQADWIAGQLSGRFDISDESNALKTGYDPVNRCWPDWLADTAMRRELLPEVVPAGAITGTVSPQAAKRYQLSQSTAVVAGVTDGCASFLATGAGEIGDAVTALGSTVTMKMLCDQPLFNPAFGVYSHRIGDRWLAGGASNTGGNVLAYYFTSDELAELSSQIDVSRAATLDYYPLLTPGERFPHNQADWQPRLSPRPSNDVEFLHELFEGMAAIESLGYQRLAELGAPQQVSVRTVGGGAKNHHWSKIRQRHLGVPFKASVSAEAAVGSALLARDAMKKVKTV